MSSEEARRYSGFKFMDHFRELPNFRKMIEEAFDAGVASAKPFPTLTLGMGISAQIGSDVVRGVITQANNHACGFEISTLSGCRWIGIFPEQVLEVWDRNQRIWKR
jgi:hypothetical protein